MSPQNTNLYNKILMSFNVDPWDFIFHYAIVYIMDLKP
jgi:hypothetical protein